MTTQETTRQLKSSAKLSAVQHYHFAPRLSEIPISFSLGDFQVFQPATERQNSLTVEDILFQGVGL